MSYFVLFILGNLKTVSCKKGKRFVKVCNYIGLLFQLSPQILDIFDLLLHKWIYIDCVWVL